MTPKNNKLKCPECGVDRLKFPCPRMADECAMIGDAHLLAQQTAPEVLTTPTTQREADDLLPCPFCGSANIDPKEWSGNDGKSGPGCDDCGALAESVEAWNSRVAPAPEYRTCCDHPDCTTCAGRGGFYRRAAPVTAPEAPVNEQQALADRVVDWSASHAATTASASAILSDAEIAGIMGWRGPGAYTESTLRKIKQVLAEDRKSRARHPAGMLRPSQ